MTWRGFMRGCGGSTPASRERSDHAVHRSFAGSGAGVGARAAGAGARFGGAGDVCGSGGDGGGVLRRAAARGWHLLPEGRVGVSAALVRAARAVQQQAYCPYSKFRVGAALEAADGRVFVGCNVESASYGLAICAERMALGAAVAAGARALKRSVVATDAEPPASPCGACRQLLAEFGLDLEVIAVGPQSERRWTLAALLPDAFAKASLDRRGCA